MKRLDEGFIEAAQSHYYGKAFEVRFEKHKNKLRLRMLKYNFLVCQEDY
jgi:hypothetical protein